MTTTRSSNGLLGLIGKPGTNKAMFLDKMARIPPGYTHMGIANTDIGLTGVVAAEDREPLVWDPRSKKWVALMRKSDGGVLLG